MLTQPSRANPQSDATASLLGSAEETTLSAISPAGSGLSDWIGDLPRNFGRYRILEQLGQGGMGSVYLAEDTNLHRKVALKTPSISQSVEERTIRRFFREARAAAAISHPNICAIYDVGDYLGHYYITMAYLKGCSLAEWLSTSGDVSPVTALRIVRKLAKALQEMHDVGIVHRDLKPSNVMMTQDDEPVIIDFGIVRKMGTADSMHTMNIMPVGTPAYMAPELISHTTECSPAADIYSLGVILYEMLAGEVPFSGSMATLMGTIVCDTPPTPNTHRKELSTKLNGLCLRAMAKQPIERYRSAASFAKSIDEFLVNG